MAVADPFRPTPARVLRRKRESADVFTLDLDAERFAFAPGQFNMLWVFGVGEAAISISGDPRGDGALVHTVRAVGTVTNALGALRRGATVGVRGPFGAGWPVSVAEGRDLLLLAGGVGLAPLRSVVYHALANRARYGRVALLYGARSPEDRIFTKELGAWARRGIDVLVTVDRAGKAWTGRVGVVTALLDELTIDPRRAVAFACGPEIMMRFAARALLERGVAADQIFVSMERSMKCAIGLCGHCQYRETFVCKDGPVVRYDRVEPIFGRREI